MSFHPAAAVAFELEAIACRLPTSTKEEPNPAADAARDAYFDAAKKILAAFTQQAVPGNGKSSGVEAALRQLVDACSGVYLDRPIPPHPEQEAANQRFESALRFARAAIQAQSRGDGAQRNHAAIGAELAAYPEVRWDRFIEYGGKVRVYGWLDRDDGRSDFLLLDLDASTGTLLEWITSAHPHPASVVERLENDTSVECRRVEDHFDAPNAVRLDTALTQQSVPEHSGVEKAVEELAKRLHGTGINAATPWDSLLEASQDRYRQLARNHLAAIQPFLAQPEPCSTCDDTRWLCDECGLPSTRCEHGGTLSESGCPDCVGRPDHPVNQERASPQPENSGGVEEGLRFLIARCAECRNTALGRYGDFVHKADCSRPELDWLIVIPEPTPPHLSDDCDPDCGGGPEHQSFCPQHHVPTKGGEANE